MARVSPSPPETAAASLSPSPWKCAQVCPAEPPPPRGLLRALGRGALTASESWTCSSPAMESQATSITMEATAYSKAVTTRSRRSSWRPVTTSCPATSPASALTTVLNMAATMTAWLRMAAHWADERVPGFQAT